PEEPDVLIDKDLLDFLLKDDAPCPEILEKENGLLEDWSTPEPELLVKEMDEFISFMLKRFEDKPGMLQDVVQVDHNYSLHQDFPMLESVKSEIAEGNVSTDLGEERQLLEKEGVSLPTSLPLTKTEERLLKKVRRKIRNKPSALGNRRRKKMYIDGLKHRVAAYTAQNRELEKKVQLLQKRNMSLLKQLRRLQALVRQSTAKTTTAKTCTMAMVLSFCLVVSPSICLFDSQEQQMKLGVLSQQIGQFPNQ
ncbi:Cyclic AMP-responsive element-binding protein 3, partial [Balearica regulorum gibbericeps]